MRQKSKKTPGIEESHPFSGMSRVSPNAGGVDCPFGALYRRLRGRLGTSQAAVTTAHALARVVCCMLKHKMEYEPLSVPEYERHYREQQLEYLHNQAVKFGLQPCVEPAEALSLLSVSEDACWAFWQWKTC